MADEHHFKRMARRGNALAGKIEPEIAAAKMGLDSIRAVSNNERLWSILGSSIGIIDSSIHKLERALAEFKGETQE